MGRLRFFATSSDQSMLTFITVEHGGVIISATDPQGFRKALIERVEQSSPAHADTLTWQQTPPTTAPWTALADVWLPTTALVGIVVLLLVLTAIAARFDLLPDQIPIHFDASGRPAQIASKYDLLRLPFLGFVCLVLNWVLGVRVHPREKVLARLLWLGGTVVQVVVL
jgi:hypothetical protein